MKKTFLPAFALAFLLAGGAHAATLILDGDFTNTNATFATVNNGSSFGPWNVSSGSIDLIGGYWQSPSLTPNAGSVDVDGNVPGIFSQNFTAPAGKYDVSFMLSGNPDGGLGTKFLQVSVGGNTQDFSYTVGAANGHGNMLYTPESFTFTTGGGPLTLTFASLDTGSSAFGPVVGNVSVSATPLPASSLLFGSGLAALALFAMRRRASAKA